MRPMVPRVRGSGIQDGLVLVVEMLSAVEAAPVVEAAPMVEAMPVVGVVFVVKRTTLAALADTGAQWTNSKVRMKASSRKK